MTAIDILTALANLGITIHYDRDREALVFSPEAGVPPALLAEIEAHRGEILQRIIPPGARGYSHQDWVWHIAHIELAQQRLSRRPPDAELLPHENRRKRATPGGSGSLLA